MKVPSLLSIFWLSLVFKLLLGSSLPLFADESYYWVWSHDLKLSYFDHPPMIAYLISLGHLLEPFFNAVRVPAILLSHLTICVWLKILKNILSPDEIKAWLLLALLSPLFGAGSLIMTPDIPLIFFWSLAILFLQAIISKPTWLNFLGIGLALGFGFLSKYNIVIFFLAVWPVLFRHKLLSIQLLFKYLLAALAFLLASSPVWIWNFKHEFLSFRFQTNHGLGASSWQASWTYGFILEQIIIIGPPVYFLIKRIYSNRCQQITADRQSLLLSSLAWGPLIFFCIATLKGRAEANWTLVAYPSIYAIAIRGYSLQSKWVKYTCIAWLLLLSLCVSQLHYPWLPVPQNAIKSGELTRYLPIKDYLSKNPMLRPAYARTFQMASKLSYELKEAIPKLSGLNRFDYFDTIEASTPTLFPFYLITLKDEDLSYFLASKNFKIQNTNPIHPNFNILEIVKK